MPTSAVENFRLAAALEYAALGWLVLPLHWPKTGAGGATRCSCGDADCGSVGKHPLTRHGLKDASADPAVIAGWWKECPAANVGVATGAGSGIVVLDVDVKGEGYASLAELQDAYGELPPTVEACTGGGGTHYVFAHPGSPVPNSAKRVGDGLDVRGDGGYVAAPPSLHASGQRYAWAPQAGPGEAESARLPPWLLAMMAAPKPAPVSSMPRAATTDDTARHWLGKALAKATYGNRNETGLWLATQLRDAGLSQSAAEGVMLDYAARCPAGEKAYTVAEAEATTRSAYGRPARESAKGNGSRPATRSQPLPSVEAFTADTPEPAAVPLPGAASELKLFMAHVIDGTIYNASFPWPALTKMTAALLPGSTMTICGDPGVGKTFHVLQSLQHWKAQGYNPAVFFIEKNRVFHTRRLLAQLEGDGRFVDFDWVPQNAAAVEAAMAKHAGTIDDLGRCIYSSDGKRVTLGGLLTWIRQMASAGKRVIVVDPITAADAGDNRWRADDDFMLAAEQIMSAHGSSLVLVTHPKKGNRPGAPTAHDQAAGAAYHRFADTNVWLYRPRKPRAVRYRPTRQSPHHPIPLDASATFPLFAQMHKTRDGKGAGLEIAYDFRELLFVEYGVVLGEATDAAPFDEGEAA